MSYDILYKISNITNNKDRLRAFAKYYCNLEINGLHYVNFYNKSKVISISRPDHSTHHEATVFLISRQNDGDSINTLKNKAQYIKKLLDFLLIWDIDISEGDLLINLIAFVNYLMCISHTSAPLNKSILWSTVKHIPLHEKAKYDNITGISLSSEGFMIEQDWQELSLATINQTLSASIEYILFLKKKVKRYKNLDVNLIPSKIINVSTILSGTLGSKAIAVPNVSAIVSGGGLKNAYGRKKLTINSGVFTSEQCDIFMNTINPNNHQNKLLFYMLKCFGLRRGEAAALEVDTSDIKKNLLYMENDKAKEYIKKNLKGDIEYFPEIDKWICKVIERDSDDFRTQHKSGPREIPLVFNQNIFLDLLLNALKQREVLLRYCDVSHSRLFVSQHYSNRGVPISGNAVYQKFTSITTKLYKTQNIDLRKYTTHSFRHFFATYLIRVKKKDIGDVSTWLGHSSPEITREIYLHYIPDEDKTINIVEDMCKTFKNQGGQHEVRMD